MISLKLRPVFHKDFSNKVFGEVPDTFIFQNSFFPKVDVLEKEKEFLIYTELPGLKKDDVKIVFENDSLSIIGERKKIYPESNETEFLRQEIFYGKFKRSFKILNKVIPESITAKFENGMLLVNIKKVVEDKQKELKIEVN